METNENKIEQTPQKTTKRKQFHKISKEKNPTPKQENLKNLVEAIESS